ncbi:MAG: hypothetical protein QW520_04015 [Methanomassiliicoccales archaeon]
MKVGEPMHLSKASNVTFKTLKYGSLNRGSSPYDTGIVDGLPTPVGWPRAKVIAVSRSTACHVSMAIGTIPYSRSDCAGGHELWEEY